MVSESVAQLSHAGVRSDPAASNGLCTKTTKASAWGRTVHAITRAVNYIVSKLQQVKSALLATFRRTTSLSVHHGPCTQSLDHNLVIFKDRLKEMSDTEFYQFIEQTFSSAKVSDEALKTCSDIRQYTNAINLPYEKQLICLQEFISRRLEDKRHTTHTGLTEANNRFMLSQEAFINDFTDFLFKHFNSGFYAQLANRAVELSRGEPTPEFPKGEVQLSPAVRGANQAMLNILLAPRDRAYIPIGGYINYLNDYPMTYGALTYEQWQCRLNSPS